jgi:hypothetical protein
MPPAAWCSDWVTRLSAQRRLEMTAVSDSYVLRVLLVTSRPAFRVEAVSRRVRRLMASLSDPYRPELHYMRGPGPKWRERYARGGRPHSA